jgi:hypothetical protein
MWKVWLEGIKCPELNYGFHCADFYETRNCLMALVGDFSILNFTQIVEEMCKQQVEIYLCP